MISFPPSNKVVIYSQEDINFQQCSHEPKRLMTQCSPLMRWSCRHTSEAVRRPNTIRSETRGICWREGGGGGGGEGKKNAPNALELFFGARHFALMDDDHTKTIATSSYDTFVAICVFVTLSFSLSVKRKFSLSFFCFSSLSFSFQFSWRFMSRPLLGKTIDGSRSSDPNLCRK
jgi:hypothetical protein